MSQPHVPPSCAVFHGFENFSFNPQIPKSYALPTTAFPNTPSQPPPEFSLLTPPCSELQSLSLKAGPCPQCKGQKYGFTAYFHNTKIFFEPPHHLLRLVEKSYILRDRLKSFLVTYTLCEIEQDRIPRVEEEMNAWQQEIVGLVRDIICLAEFELDFALLEAAKIWTFEKVDRLREHVWGRRKLEMPKGSLQMFLSEYRKVWEGVWIGYLKDEKAAWGRMLQAAS